MQWVLDLLSLTQTAEHAHLMHAIACTYVHSSNSDSERGFSILRKIQTDQRPTLKLSTLISLMSVKFNSEECCHLTAYLVNNY